MSLPSRTLRGLTGLLGGSRTTTRGLTRGLSVFTFHDVTDNPSPFQTAADVATPTEVFRSQVEWIARTFDVIDPVRIGGSGSLPSNAAVITFDDAWSGTFTNGFAILDELEVPAIAFLNYCGVDHGVDATALAAFERGFEAGFPDMSHRHDRPADPDSFRAFQGELVSESTINGWDGHPRFWFGSHLYWHVVSIGAKRTELEESYQRNAERLAELDNGIRFVSFPFGQPGDHFDDSHVATIQRLGAERLFSARSRVNRGPLAYLVDRTSMPTGDPLPGQALMNLLHRELLDRLGRTR